MKHYDRIILVGDFNFPQINWTLPKDDWFVETLRDSFLCQHTSMPTRHRENQKQNILDLVLTREDQDILHIDYCSPIGASDHLLLKIYTSFQIVTEPISCKQLYDYNKGYYCEYNEFIKLHDWDMLNNLNIEEAWKEIKNKILEGRDKYVPKIKLCNKKSQPVWMNVQVKKSIKNKYYLFKKFLSSNNSVHYKEYVEARNHCTKLIKKEKRNHEKNIASKAKTNPKAFWNFINSKRKTKQNISILKMTNGDFTHNDQEKAQALQDLFTSVFTRENLENIPILPPGSLSDNKFLSSILITESAVLQKLNLLNPCKTPGDDNLHPRLLKELSESLAKPITFLFNKSLSESELPNDWKRAQVSAIFKKGVKTDPNNYRSVSLTSILCKVLEGIIRDSIQNFFDDLNLYTNCQHGFRRKRSCISQLLEVMEDFTDFIDKGEAFDTIYLDFRKAFDSVPHERLLLKLEAYGISGQIILWIRNFLTNREQTVRVGSDFSEPSKVLSVIPQGSILGPVLFTIFINDLPEGIDSFCKIFADDTKVYNTIKNANIIQED